MGQGMKDVLQLDIRQPSPPSAQVYARFFIQFMNSPLKIWTPFGSVARIERTTPYVRSPMNKEKSPVFIVGEILWDDTVMFRTNEQTLNPGDRFDIMFGEAGFTK